jgi:hypothetical protein
MAYSSNRTPRNLKLKHCIVGICRKLVKAAGFLPDICNNCRRKLGQKTSTQLRKKEETGLRCGGRGKSEISSAL